MSSRGRSAWRRRAAPTAPPPIESGAGGSGAEVAGPNCVALRTSSGVTPPSQGTVIGANAGGVGRQTPGAGGLVNSTGALRPSSAR
jgi:hypothetical protein